MIRLALLMAFVTFLVTCTTFKSRGLTRPRVYKPLTEVDSLYTDIPLGVSFTKGTTIFRVFAPNATRINLVLLPRYDADEGDEYSMVRDRNGVWTATLIGRLAGQVYGYRAWGPEGAEYQYDPGRIISDPYARVVISQNNYQRHSRALIPWGTSFDWDGDTWIPLDPSDAVIYECHIRDMTAHPTAEASRPGTYLGFLEDSQKGGINHLVELGINAVELLPVFDFGNIEIPYRDSTNGVYNDWNPYARNHWGYLPTHYFAPEAYYAAGGNLAPDSWLGWTGYQVQEFKELVKRLHRHGIAVILDVVYNHVSPYDLNPLKFIDKAYYFRLNPEGSFRSANGFGNDLRTEAPMVRRLILDSVLYWMEEYHIDGFRFDLAGLIDTETARQILREARKINPDVFMIAEPWGGPNYVPDKYADLGWAAWNDQFRNGIKGQDPRNDRGFIFGEWQGQNNNESLKRYLVGSPRSQGGQFHNTGQSVNYLAAHDGYTLGDFIRIATGDVHPDEVITDLASNAAVTGKSLAMHKLAALCLLTAQGAAMIHEGQEFARSKVIAPTDAPDPRVGLIDHNSYEKDNATNYLDWRHKELNRDLFRYYQGLVRLRNAHPAFRHTASQDIQFIDGKTPFGLAFLLPVSRTGDTYDFLILLNGNREQPEEFELPAGQWAAVVTGNQAGVDPVVQGLSGVITIPPTTGMVLRK